MFRPRSLLVRLIASFLSLLLIGIAVSSFFSWIQARTTVEKVVYDELQAAASVKRADLQEWVERQRKQIVLMSQLPDVRILCEDLAPDGDGPVFVEAQEYLRGLLNSVTSSVPGLAEVFILSWEKGKVLVSTNESHEGLDRSGQAYFEMGRDGVFLQNLYLPEGESFPAMTVSAPIKDSQGETLAVLAGRLNLDDMNEEVMVWTSFQEGRKVFLVDRRFGILNKHVAPGQRESWNLNTEGIRKSLAGASGYGAYMNHAGRKVMGVYQWIREWDLGLLVEVDEKRGLAQARRIAGTVLGTGIIVACILAVAVYFLSLRFVRPITAITRATQAAAKGDLTQKVPVRSRDEMGVLAENFNSMISQLQALYAAMEVKIDQLQQAKETIADRERWFRALIENATDIVTILNANGIITYQSPSVERILGLDPVDMVGRSVLDWFHPQDAENFEELLLSMIERPGTPQVAEFRLRHRDGTWRILELLGNNLLADPLIDGVILNIREVTERRQAERALEEEKERLAVTLRSIGDGVIATDGKGLIRLFNEEAQRLTGWSVSDALGRPARDVLHIHHVNREDGRLDLAGAVLTSGRVEPRGDAMVVSMDGISTPISSSASPITDENGRAIGAILILRDVTQRRKYETELQKIDKLESIGVLAGGIAHDFNNILTGVLGSISLAKLYGQGNQKIVSKLQEAERACLTARELTQQLLTFARGGAPVKESASLAELLKECVGFVLSGSKVRCEYSVPEDLMPAEVDASQIRQVIQNLVINATQAMPQGGILYISAQNVKVEEKDNLPLPPGQYVEMSIRDQGEGIPPEDLSNIFDPYFTTKQEGSGLGLATAYSIVKKHDGHIGVESALGVGTSFTVYLPASDSKPVSKENQSQALDRGQGKVLLMDDEEVVRDVTGEILEFLGFAVTTVADGAQAVAAYEEAMDKNDPYAIVIMDLTVPGGMGGKEAMEKIWALDKQAKAIVSSGYSQDPIMSEFRQFGFSGVIAKPFTPENLMRVINRVLEL
ncbi:PAS domain S-box-containing protein [Desulfatibacillum alkenivorans DSM 16219]|jgi:PAS domain S-box-containing protein|uniref:histidine kinase n=1 Tax=Desulfatibacillum alkenivorans DSM 16219 TaxID=1121393 RepID=A0A1M6JXZ2_9BACT|nr:PAS domain S-box protein [Desulfatibacillum alkenivorans]SHJ51501.1 PAS domain S-box-containing protein [Desulfatibacillum alkenivorans DSM 16219]